MVSEYTMILSLIGTIFASGGFWAFLTYIIQRKDSKNSIEKAMLKGLAHDKICELGMKYLRQGHITYDEYENLHDYLYIPYTKLGGNGTAEKIMKEVGCLAFQKEEIKTYCQGANCKNARV